MPQLAAAAGVDIDVVDSGGQATMSRPTGERAIEGPLARTLAERLNGSSASVHARGEARSMGRGIDHFYEEAALLAGRTLHDPYEPDARVIDASTAKPAQLPLE